VAVELEVIDDDDELYRRLTRHHVKEDGQVSSSAYKRGKDPDPEVSANLARRSSHSRASRIVLGCIQQASLAEHPSRE
jgi:hypothetical protein